MKKLFLTLFCFGCFSLSSVSMDKISDREALVDSLACRLMKFPDMRTLNPLSLSKDSDSNRDRVAVDYMFWRISSKLLYEAVADFSDAQLNALKTFLDSRLCRVLTSRGFWKSYAEYHFSAYRMETGADVDFSYKIHDAGFASLAETIRKEYRPQVESFASAATAGMKMAGMNNLQAMSKVKHFVPEVFVHAMMDFLSYEEVADVDVKSALDLMQRSMSGMKSSLQDTVLVNAIRREMLDDRRFLDEVSRYVMYYRHVSMPSSYYVGVLGDVALGKKYIYSGPLRDGMPHGCGGELTDAKGVRYEGDFKNGKRHGLIKVHTPGMETRKQVWIDGKYCKSIAAVPPVSGVPTAPGRHEGRAFGYGVTYDASTKTYTEGFFIDGNLNHSGKVDSPVMTLEGDFLKGELYYGTITWKLPDWNIYRMDCGQVDGLRVGKLTQVSSDGTFKKVSEGFFVGTELEGKGKVTTTNSNAHIVREGMFARGLMYGKGKITITANRAKEGYEETRVYEGWISEDRRHGDGVFTIRLADIPDKGVKLTRGGVRLALHSSKEMTVTMEGRFEKGNLVQGSVMCSDGSYMQGTFRNGVLEQGRMLKTYSDGSRYEGECMNGKYNGYGQLVYADGTEYRGLFENGYVVDYKDDRNSPDVRAYLKSNAQRNHRAYYEEKVFRFENLPVQNGVVRVVTVAGVKILLRNVSAVDVECKGEFVGETFRSGKVTISDGNWMEGIFEDGVQISGRARREDKYGTIYEGDIKNGYPHGKGKATYKNGTWFKGNFANGNRMNGTHYTADGRVIKVYE